MSRVKVAIDHLVLRGLEPDQSSALIAGLRTELARIMGATAERGDAIQSRRTPVLRPGRMSLDAGPAGGRRLGQNLAGAVGRSLKP